VRSIKAESASNAADATSSSYEYEYDRPSAVLFIQRMGTTWVSEESGPVQLLAVEQVAMGKTT